MTGATDTEALQTEFAGDRGALFRLALKTGLWTVLTLGLYRFWMKTRLRRWYWSAIRPGGLPLEYVGDPLEKLLGFFIAVVIMAFYIGIVNLILMFASLSLFATNVFAYVLSFVGIIPILFFALYRARRYVLARTRWRGIRFGLLPGAWGYALRALALWLLTLSTLGLLWPLKTFYLEKYRTDRTVFGTVTLRQGGRWTMLVRPFLPVALGVALTVGITAAGLTLEIDALIWGYVLALPILLGGMIHYSAQATRLMAEHKTAGDLGLRARPRTAALARIYVFGYLATVLLSLLPLFPIATIVGLIQSRRFLDSSDPTSASAMPLGIPLWVWTALGILAYFVVLLLWSVLRHCFVTLPVWRHYARTLTILNPAALARVRQRERDEFEEAEGFAEALDLGAAI